MTTEGATCRRPSRRLFLGSLAAGTVALAGCSSFNSGDGPEKVDEPREWPPVLGDPESQITLEVFEDFNCPHCQEYSTEQLPTVRSEYLDPGLIRYEHRDLPIPVHPTSWNAASAAREVYRLYGNESFWTYSSELMSEGRRIQQDAPDIFGEIANQQNLDGEIIQDAAGTRTHDDGVEADRSRAIEYDVQGTPAFVVDGELSNGLSDAMGTINAKLSG